MNVKNFLIDALTSALEMGLATPDDVLEYVTPATLAESLPRPLWTRLLTACVGAPRVDAQLIVETIGVQNLCEHVPAPIIWGIVAKVAARSLGGVLPERPRFTSPPSFETRTPTPMPLAVSAPPPLEQRDAKASPPPPPGPSIPASINASTLAEAGADDEASRTPSRARTPTGQRFRQSNTGIGRLASSTRRPQASAGAPDPVPATASGRIPRRSETEVEMEVETEAAPAQPAADWRSSLAVEDDQLVDWSSSEETQTVTGDDGYSRKR